MKDQTASSNKPSRRSFAGLIAASLAAIPIGLSNVAGQTRNPNKRKQGKKFQGSPITVGGGGSVSISFNHDHYAGASGRYSNPTDEILTTQVFDRFTSLKYELASFVKDIDCTVTIHTTRKNGTDPKDIIIRSKPTGPFSVEFDEVVFRLKTGSKQLHYQEDRKIVGVIEVLDNFEHLRTTLTPPTDGVCAIHFLNSRD